MPRQRHAHTFPLLVCFAILSAAGCGLGDRADDGAGGDDVGPSSACTSASELICAAACACGGCDIVAQRPGATVRFDADDEASCVESYLDSCANDERTDAELEACAAAYADAECSDGAAVQPEACVVTN